MYYDSDLVHCSQFKMHSCHRVNSKQFELLYRCIENIETQRCCHIFHMSQSDLHMKQVDSFVPSTDCCRSNCCCRSSLGCTRCCSVASCNRKCLDRLYLGNCHCLHHSSYSRSLVFCWATRKVVDSP